MNWSVSIRYDLIWSGVIVLHQIYFNLLFIHFLFVLSFQFYSVWVFNAISEKTSKNVFRFNFNIWYVVNVCFFSTWWQWLFFPDLFWEMYCVYFTEFQVGRSKNTLYTVELIKYSITGNHFNVAFIRIIYKPQHWKWNSFFFQDCVTTLKSHINSPIRPDQTRQQ